MKTAKLFRNGRSQAVRLPREFRLPGNEVQIKRIGQSVLLTPFEKSWQSLEDATLCFSQDFIPIRSQPETQEREAF